MTDETCPRCQGRPRSEKSAAAIMRATLELLGEKPLRDVSIEAIAAKAGVGKATIYKWWPSKACLALDAFLDSAQMNVEIPNTGSARRDLIEHMKSMSQFHLSKMGRIFCQFIFEGQLDPAFAAKFRKVFLTCRREAARVMLQRGIERGEIRPGADSDLTLDLLYGPLVYRQLAGHGPMNIEEAEKIAAAVFESIRTEPGAAARPARRKKAK